MCEGIDGVTAAYYHSIQRVQLYGNEPCQPLPVRKNHDSSGYLMNFVYWVTFNACLLDI